MTISDYIYIEVVRKVVLEVFLEVVLQVVLQGILQVVLQIVLQAESEKPSNLPRNHLQQTQTFFTIAVIFKQKKYDFVRQNKKRGAKIFLLTSKFLTKKVLAIKIC